MALHGRFGRGNLFILSKIYEKVTFCLEILVLANRVRFNLVRHRHRAKAVRRLLIEKKHRTIPVLFLLFCSLNRAQNE